MGSAIITGAALIGLLVGTFVGLTGLGGGLLLLPLLISVLGVPPLVAVGSDLVISCTTKMGAGGLHWYHGNVRWPLVVNLAYGSVPGAVLGVFVLTRIRTVYGSTVNGFLHVAAGVLLVVIPILYLTEQNFLTGSSALDAPPKTRNKVGVAMIGLVAGFLVGVTSIGAGSVILIMLLVFCGIPATAAVGTDIVHGVLLAGMTGLLQFKLLRNVDLVLVGSVLAGSLPGSILGVYLTKYLSSAGLKRILCGLLVLLGARMLWSVSWRAK